MWMNVEQQAWIDVAQVNSVGIRKDITFAHGLVQNPNMIKLKMSLERPSVNVSRTLKARL